MLACGDFCWFIPHPSESASSRDRPDIAPMDRRNAPYGESLAEGLCLNWLFDRAGRLCTKSAGSRARIRSWLFVVFRSSH